jgi:hypothetical protein
MDCGGEMRRMKGERNSTLSSVVELDLRFQDFFVGDPDGWRGRSREVTRDRPRRILPRVESRP